MRIICHYRNDPERPPLDPTPEAGGRRFVFRLYSGDVCRPVFGQWFGPRYPRFVIRFFCRWPVLPLIAWRWPFLERVGYVGFKPFGADSEAYKNWMKPDEVYAGSQALCPSIRPIARF